MQGFHSYLADYRVSESRLTTDKPSGLSFSQRSRHRYVDAERNVYSICDIKESYDHWDTFSGTFSHKIEGMSRTWTLLSDDSLDTNIFPNHI